MDETYYIRIRGRSSGPFDVKTLHAMARRGRFARHNEVSTDRETWFRASEYPELFPERAEKQKPVHNSKSESFALEHSDADTIVEFVDERKSGKSSRNKASDEAKWYYHKDDKQIGPVTVSDIGELLQRGVLKKNSFVWYPGRDWTVISETPEFDAFFGKSGRGSQINVGNHNQNVSSTTGTRASRRNKVLLVMVILLAVLAIGMTGLAFYFYRDDRNASDIPGGEVANNENDEPAANRKQSKPDDPQPNDPENIPDKKRADTDKHNSDAGETSSRKKKQNKGSANNPNKSQPTKTSPKKQTTKFDYGEQVGWVICGRRITYSDGTKVEIPKFSGTCFSVTPNGYLITNKHVVESTVKLSNAKLQLEKWEKDFLVIVKPTVWVFFKKKKYIAKIIHVSDDFDFAILKINRQKTPFFSLSDGSNQTRGKQVYSCGFPGAQQKFLLTDDELDKAVRKNSKHKSKVEKYFNSRDFEYGMTSGIISRVVTDSDQHLWIQHNADINHGNSGGPLIDKNGVVLGINTQGIPDAAGIFLALSVNQLKEELKEHVSNVVWK